jgi:hypothetical protein
MNKQISRRRRQRQGDDSLEDDSDTTRRKLVRSTAARHSWTGRRQAALERVHARQRQLVAQAWPTAELETKQYHNDSADSMRIPLIPDGFHDSHQISPVPYEARYGNLMHHRMFCNNIEARDAAPC